MARTKSKIDIDQLYLPFGPPVLTRQGIRRGVIASIPYCLGLCVFGFTAGLLAQKAGLSLIEAVVMNGLVYAGASQLAVLSHWPSVWSMTTVLATALVLTAINSRFVLMSASLYPYFRHLPGWRPWALLFLKTDVLWLLFLREAQLAKEEKHPPDLGFFIGFAVVMWWGWTLIAIPGWWFGSMIVDLKRYGLDLIVLMFFASLLVPMWKGFSRAFPWAVAGLAAAAASYTLPGSYYIVIGALAGSLAGALLKHD